jgi:hypothetical protein
MAKYYPTPRQYRHNALMAILFFLVIALLTTFRLLGRIEQRSSRPGQAAYHKTGPNLVPDTYFVAFHSNHTLQAHFDYLGRNLSETASRFNYVPGLGGYYAVLDSYTLHEEIRYDPGVFLVSHSRRIKPMKVEVQGSRDGPSSDFVDQRLNRRGASWFKTTTLNAGYGSAMISAPNKTDFSSRKGTYVSIAL